MRNRIKAEQCYGRPKRMEEPLWECTKLCIDKNMACPRENSDCRHWMDYDKELNCVLNSIHKNDSMTLREVGDRLGISFVRVKQIEDKALKKISHLLKDRAI